MWFCADLRTDTGKTCVGTRIGLYAQNTLTIQGSIGNIIRETCMTGYWARKPSTLLKNNMFIWAPEIVRQLEIGKMLISNHLAQILCFISYKKCIRVTHVSTFLQITSHHKTRRDKIRIRFAEQCKIVTTKVGGLGIVEESIYITNILYAQQYYIEMFFDIVSTKHEE